MQVTFVVYAHKNRGIEKGWPRHSTFKILGINKTEYAFKANSLLEYM